MVKEFERDIPQVDEQQIRSTNFGGLNTIASPLNIPYEDSPLLLNALTDISGNVTKRPGTRVLYFENNVSSRSVTVVPFATGLSYNYLVVKRDVNLQVFEVNNDVATVVLTKKNVWDSRARDARASYVTTSEVEPRIIFCTGANKPVQLKFTEQQFIQTTQGTTATIPNAQRFKNATTSNCVVFVNRVRYSGATFSYSAGTLTVSGLPSTAVGDVIDLCLITWQWWAEGMLWQGNRMYDTSTRYNAVATDQNVKVPDKLITDADPSFVQNNYNGMLNVYRRSQNNTGSSYTYVSNLKPSTANDWAYGDGTRYAFSADNFVNPSPFFITFGTVQSPTDPSSIYITRRRNLKFNNGNGALAQYVDVYVDGVKRSLILNLGDAADQYKNYRLLTPDLGTYATSTSTLVNYIAFEGTFLGVPQNSKVEYANNERKHIGSSAISSLFDYNDGSYVIAYGLGTVADYNSGFYPRTVNLYQSRVILSGFAHRPLTVLFSGVGDTSIAGNFYANYQITNDSALATDAFDVVISSRADDRIISLIEWQAALFVLTRKAVFRLSGTEGRPLSPSSRAVNFISATGCVNESCVAQADFKIVYLSDTGLYDLTPQIENGEYQVRELSIKIRDKFGITTDPRYEAIPWVSYDAENRLVLVGYPANGEFWTTRNIYVYNTFRDSWTEYDTPGGFNTFSACRYVDRLVGNNFLAAVTTERGNSNVPNSFMLLKFNDSRYIDYRQVTTVASPTTQNYITPIANVTHTVTDGKLHYGISYAATQQVTAFTSCPVIEVYDVRVTATLNGAFTVLKDGVDYVKEQNGQIYLLKSLQDGTQLTIQVRSPEPSIGDAANVQKALVVFENNVLTNNYVVVNSNSNRYIQFANSAVNSVVEWGNAYLCIYTTPLFLLKTLQNFKRVYHIYAYFDNRSGITLQDRRNVTAGQDKQQVIDSYKSRVNCNLTMLYNSDYSGETSSDIYGFEEVYWDDAVFDIAPAATQAQPFQLFKEPIQGVGWAYQFMTWNYDDSTFKLAAYQIEAKPKGKRNTGRY